MPRTPRDWSDIRADIRSLLRESDAANSYWSDALLLTLFNFQIEKRHMDLADAHEGWVTSSFTSDLVAGQKAYALPPGSGRVKRVVRVHTDSSRTTEATLTRAEHWEGVRDVSASNASSPAAYRPSYRLLGNELRLDHPPSFSETAGLRIDLEFLPDRIALDTDTLDTQYPDTMETMLIWDTAYAAMCIEGAQGNLTESYIDSVRVQRDEFEGRFTTYVQTRSYGRIFSTPQNME